MNERELLRNAIKILLGAIRRAEDEGVLDHFDCMTDRGEAFGKAISHARAVLAATEGKPTMRIG